MQGLHREIFPILESKPYFNACSIGPLANSVRNAMEQFLDDWNGFGGIAWIKDGGWNEIVEKARRSFANLIGTNAENIAYSFGNSVAFSSVLSAFEFESGDNILFNQLDFPSFPSYIMARAENNFQYKVVPEEDGLISVNKYTDEMDEKTKLVTACEVASNTGARIDVKALSEESHDRDIPLFLDTYQSTGVIPMNVEQLDVDFLATGCLKWLVGGFGMSFLYIRDDWLEKLDPNSIGWMGVDDPFQDLFDTLRTQLHRPQDAQKFQYGTPYPFGAVSATEGMKIIEDIGIRKIHNHDMKITDEIINTALDLGYQVLTSTKPEERGSIVNIQVDQPQKVVDELQNEGFILDMRSNGIRVAPHFYNNSDDVSKLFSTLKKITH